MPVFEWEEGGLDLLEVIKEEINKVGGRVRMMQLIMDENWSFFSHADRVDLNSRISKHNWVRQKRKHYIKSDKRWSQEDVDYVTANFGRIKTVRIAKTIERTPCAVRNKFREKASEEQKAWVCEHGLRAESYKNYKLYHEQKTKNNLERGPAKIPDAVQRDRRPGRDTQRDSGAVRLR